MNPEVGEIWRWMFKNPALLLKVEGREGNIVTFLCLDLGTNVEHRMSFHPTVMEYWTRLA
jgi:hypothetical protein